MFATASIMILTYALNRFKGNFIGGLLWILISGIILIYSSKKRAYE